MNSTSLKKIVRLLGMLALLVLTLYLFYGIIGSLYTWRQQPIFESASSKSRSYGFLVVACSFGGVFLLSLAVDFLYYYFFYIRPRKNACIKCKIKDE